MSIKGAEKLAAEPLLDPRCRRDPVANRPAAAAGPAAARRAGGRRRCAYLRNGERMLVSGPSGAGKSTLFRAIAGIWPFGDGAITIPAGATLMMLPQRPYFPIGSLHAAMVYPSEAGASTSSGSERCSTSGFLSLPRGWMKRSTGTGCCRSASSCASAWRARCCTHRTSCSSMRRPPRSTSRWRPRSIACSAKAAGHHPRLDRPPLDAGSVSRAQAGAGP